MERLEQAFPVSLRHVLHRVRDVADQLDLRVALVGGVPRDLMRLTAGTLHRDQFIQGLNDLDLVVEGPMDSLGGAGVRFAYELARRLPGKLTINDAFHTATLVTSDPLVIDIATARREEYALPGELPLVDPSGVSIEQDMLRRDFTINALALELAPDSGKLVDPTGGAGDLNDRLVRVLHSASFSDDPTRLLRALRYSMRLDFDLEPVTLSQYQVAIDEGVLDLLTPERVRYEIECIGREGRWIEIWAVMDLSRITLGLSPSLSNISGHWKLEDAAALDIAMRNFTEAMPEDALEPWLTRTAWVLGHIPVDIMEDTARRLGLYERDIRTIVAARNVLRGEVPRLMEGLKPSVVYRALTRHPRRAVLLAMFNYQPDTQAGVEARKALKRYLEEYSLVRGMLNGHDLVALGTPPGPLVGSVTDQLKYLRLDGVVSSRSEEEAKASELITKLIQAESIGEE